MATIDYGRWELQQPSALQPITLEDFKNFRNLSITDTTFDTEYTLFMNSAIRLIEQYLNYNILNTNWNYYLRCFDNIIYSNHYSISTQSNFFTIFNKGNIQSIQKISYLKEGVWQEIASTDYLFEKRPIVYSEFIVKSKDYFPDDYDTFNDFNIECVKIELISGFGDTVDVIPIEIKLALLQLASALYDSKGVCEYDNSILSCTIFHKISHLRAVNQLY